MNILEAFKEMTVITSPDSNSIRAYLEDDYHVIVGDKNNYGDAVLKYDLFIEDGLLYIGKVSDSSSTQTVITLEMAAIYDAGIFEAIWSSYLSGKDVFMLDSIGYMHEALISPNKDELSALIKDLKPGQILALTSKYSPPDFSDIPKTKIYIEDNKEARIVGREVVEDSLSNAPNTTIVSDKDKADFTILILPNDTRAPHNRFYEWLDDETHDIPVVSEVLKEKNMTFDKKNHILLYWSSNVLMSGLVDPDSTRVKAITELQDAIKTYHKQRRMG